MALTNVFSGAQSATFTTDTAGGFANALGQADWAALKSGQLKDVLNRTYDSFPAFFTAWAEAGGLVSALVSQADNGQPARTTTDYSFSLSGGYPRLNVAIGDVPATYSLAVRISVSYSASA